MPYNEPPQESVTRGDRPGETTIFTAQSAKLLTRLNKSKNARTVPKPLGRVTVKGAFAVAEQQPTRTAGRASSSLLIRSQRHHPESLPVPRKGWA